VPTAAGALPVFAAARPLVFAHRGGAGLAPENTLPAFQRGLAEGADGLEFDVRLSADGVPMVIHDATLDRTTDGTGPVAARTAAELARLDAGFHFGRDRGHPWRARGARIPRLDETLDAHPGIPVIIEIKDDDLRAAEAVVAAVRATRAEGTVCVGSFHHLVLQRVRALAPAVATGASLPEAWWTMVRSKVRWPWVPPRPFQAFQVPEYHGGRRVLTPAFVRQAHDEGARVQIWVIDDLDAMRRLLDWGADGIITDRPDIIVPALLAYAGRAVPAGRAAALPVPRRQPTR
jgi:glycerophosphoryl diester phosphodiesterase